MAKLSSTRRRKPNRIPILVVEDNADQWLIIRSALSQCFPEVEPIWVNTADQANIYLDGCSFDEVKLPRLILLDLYLPRREDSLGLLVGVKAHPVYRQVPVIMLSESDEAEDIARSYAAGVASYIVKPTTYHQWLTCFYTFRRYWWESVKLPLSLMQRVNVPEQSSASMLVKR